LELNSWRWWWPNDELCAFTARPRRIVLFGHGSRRHAFRLLGSHRDLLEPKKNSPNGARSAVPQLRCHNYGTAELAPNAPNYRCECTVILSSCRSAPTPKACAVVTDTQDSGHFGHPQTTSLDTEGHQDFSSPNNLPPRLPLCVDSVESMFGRINNLIGAIVHCCVVGCPNRIDKIGWGIRRRSLISATLVNG